MTDPAKVAGSLTEPMANALLFNMRGYHDPNTVGALRRRGLVEGITLTPLGQAVAAYLKEKKDG